MASCLPESTEKGRANPIIVIEEFSSTASTSDDDQSVKEPDEGKLEAASPTYLRQGSYDSEDFAKCNFSLSVEEIEKSLNILHTSKAKAKTPFKDVCHTYTSHWSRKPLAASAAYKIFKVKRWLLKNVSLIFDPYDEDEATITVRRSSILWPDPHTKQPQAQDKLATLNLKALSVDGLLAKAQAKDVAIESLEKLDEVLKGINQNTPRICASAVRELLLRLPRMGTLILPYAAQGPFMNFAHALIRAMDIGTRGGKAKEKLFQYMFQQLFRCVAACIKEDRRVNCSMTLDGEDMDKMELFTITKSRKTIVVSSIPDLFMFERGLDGTTKRVVAVVEVKGKAKDQVLHSDDEEENEEEEQPLGVIDEESEEELSLLEKMKTKKKRHMKRLDRDSRRYTRKFLPQLLGEMLCCSETEGLEDVKTNQLGSTLGIAVVGFDVYFVTLVTSPKRVQDMLSDPQSYLDVFITRPFYLCNRRDRQIIIKVLSAACYRKEPLDPLLFKSKSSIDGLDLSFEDTLLIY